MRIARLLYLFTSSYSPAPVFAFLLLSSQTNGIFELKVKNSAGKEETWTIDMKKEGTVYKGAAKPKADVTIILSDDTFTQLAEGKLDGQKAFMTGKLKTKGNMMLATKLDGVLKVSTNFRSLPT